MKWRRLSKAGCAVAAAILLMAIIAGLIAYAGSIGDPCGKDAKRAAYVRKLSPARMEKLYSDMQALVARSRKEGRGRREILRDDKDFPPEFADIPCLKIRPEAADPCIMLEGCRDHFLYLDFYGPEMLMPWTGPPRIMLSYGEGPDDGKEVLWTKP